MPDAAAAPADNPDLVKEHIAGFEAADGRLREVAKWFVTSAAALAALLIGTSPLSGLASLGLGSELLGPLGFGALALVALGTITYVGSRVLAPATVDFETVSTSPDFEEFRTKIAAAPYDYLGTWADDVPAFARTRRRWATALESIDAQIEDPATPAAAVKALQAAREKVILNNRRMGWVTQRLLAGARNHLLWERFRITRVVAAVATGVVVLGIVGFLTTVNAATSADDFTGPVPVRVALTDAGKRQLQPVLGQSCPADSFEALLTGGGKTAPWEVMVVDAGCTRGQLTLTKDDARVLFVSAPG